MAGEHRSGEAWTGRVCFVQVRSVVVRQVSLWQGENGSVEDEWGVAVEAGMGQSRTFRLGLERQSR